GLADRPLHSDLRIKKKDSRLSMRVIDAGAFVLHLTIVGQRAKTAGEAVRGPDLLFVVGGNFNPKPLTQSWGAFANVNRHQKRGSMRHSHKLAHRRGPL